MSISSAFHTIDTVASGAVFGVVMGMWVLPYIWSHFKTVIAGWVSSELAKASTAAPALKPVVAVAQAEVAKV